MVLPPELPRVSTETLPHVDLCFSFAKTNAETGCQGQFGTSPKEQQDIRQVTLCYASSSISYKHCSNAYFRNFSGCLLNRFLQVTLQKWYVSPS
jgi:hypothetical protein